MRMKPRWRCTWFLAALVAGMGPSALPSILASWQSHPDGPARVLLPTDGLGDPAVDTGRLIQVLGEQDPLPGLPVEILSSRMITVSLVAGQLRGGKDAMSRPIDGLIILPVDAALEWPVERLHRTVRHELAHIGLSVFLDHASVPLWFCEGFAEWASGGLTCEGEARIRLDLMSRAKQGIPLPRLLESAGVGKSRLSYDYFAAFFEFIEGESDGLLSRGSLLESVKAQGVGPGLSRALRTDLGELEDQWHFHLSRHYAGLPEDYSCPAW